MSNIDEIREAIKAIAGKSQQIIIPAKVKNTDKAKYTCTVEFEGIELEDVRLTAVNNSETKSVIIPAVGSDVLIGFVGGSDTDAVVLAYSQIDEMIINSDKITLGNEQTAEKTLKGESLKNMLNNMIIHLQTMNALLLAFGNAQATAIANAAVLAPLAPAYAALVSGLTGETAKLTKMITDLVNSITDKVKIG